MAFSSRADAPPSGWSFLHSVPTSDVEDCADYVIVGTGAAGATAARVLAEVGADVLLVEEGPYVPPDRLGRGTAASFLHVFRDNGGQTTGWPLFIPLLQGACVGGSTVINSGIMWRTPGPVLREWHRKHGLEQALPERALDECFETLERELSIAPTSEETLGANGRNLLAGAHALDWEAGPTRRSESGCEGSSRCLEGCRRSHRQSMNHSYIPRALSAGARLHASCRVERIYSDWGREPELFGTFSPASPGAPRARFRATARRAILVAASAVHTPALLQRSGFDHTGRIGQHFQGHPGVALLALFDSPVRLWEGATQSAEISHFASEGFKIETLNLPPEILAVRMPGVGRSLMENFARMDRIALSAIPIKARAQGTIRTNRRGGIDARYVPTADDVHIALQGLRRTAEAYFAAGARAVYPGVHGLPQEITNPSNLGKLTETTVPPQSLSWVMTHLMGTCRMGGDASSSATDILGQVHGAPGVHVIDSSLFPTNLGVNPQHTIMAVAMHLTRRIARL